MHEIIHNEKLRRFETTVEKQIAYASYRILEGEFDIFHVYVPVEARGMGLAAKLVERAFAYAREKGFKEKATCPYAHLWLKRYYGEEE